MRTITIENGREAGVHTTPMKRKTLHMVYLVDASGSMNLTDNTGKSKYQVAFEGINSEISEQRSVEDNVDVLMSIYEFDSNKSYMERITEHCLGKNVKELESNVRGRGASGNTPLYQSIAYVIEVFLRKASNNDQVVIKVFTDGAHNCYWGKYGNEKVCRSLIQDVQNNRNFTITFVGTTEDTESAIRTLGIYANNTATYDGTAKGLGETFSLSNKKSLKFRSSYSTSVGQLNNTDFFDSGTKAKEVSPGSTTSN